MILTMEGVSCLYGQSIMNHISLENEAIDIADFTRRILANTKPHQVHCMHKLTMGNCAHASVLAVVPNSCMHCYKASGQENWDEEVISSLWPQNP